MHPQIAGHDWNLEEVIYDDGRAGIAVGLFSRNTSEGALGFRWMYDGDVQHLAGKEWRSPYFGKSSEWGLLPHDFAVPICHVLISKHATGLSKISDVGIKKLVAWMMREEELLPHMGY